MRIIKFAKIDFNLSKKFSAFLILFALLSFFLMAKDSDGSPYFATLYCLFAGIILSTSPRNSYNRTESGFLTMLPAKPGENVKGQFLFAFCFLLFSLLLSFLSIRAAMFIQPGLSFGPMHYYLLIFGAALIFTGIENVIHYLLPASLGSQASNFIRMLPGFLFFFGSLLFADNLSNTILRFAVWITPLRSILLFLACVVIFLIFMGISILQSNRRDAL